MRASFLPLPQPAKMCKWDGTNLAEMNAYLAEADSGYGTVSLVSDADGTRIVHDLQHNTHEDQPVAEGEWVWAQPSGYWPTVSVYRAAEMNAKFYPYPDLPQAVATTLGQVL